MVSSRNTRIVRKGEHRLYHCLNTILITNAAIVIAARYLADGNAKTQPGECMAFQSNQLEAEILLPICGPLEVALLDRTPDAIHVGFAPLDDLDFSHLGYTSSGVTTAVTNIIIPVLLEFYENNTQFFWDKYGKPENYPAVWRFARVIRNAVAHGGQISYDKRSRKESPVQWRSVTYSPADEGKRIFGFTNAELIAGDLLGLMFDMSDLLDSEGCPI